MATTELVASQAIHETVEGVTMNRVFTTTWTDYAVGTSNPRTVPYGLLNLNPFPFRIGDCLTYDNLAFPVVNGITWNLRITDIRVSPTDNENIVAEVFYSSVYDRVSKRYEPDTNASWEEQFDISSFESSDDIYYDGAGLKFWKRAQQGVQQDWAAEWKDADQDADKKPAHSIMAPNWVWEVKAYSSKLWLKRIVDNMLSVNSNLWLRDYFMNIANRNGYWLNSAPNTHITDVALLTDTERWLFVGCPIRRVQFNSWEYRFQFMFNFQWPWNMYHGISQDKYPTLNFTELFENMQQAPASEGQSGARS